MFSTYLWKRSSKKLTYFWAVLGSVLLQSEGLALFFHRCYQHLPSPNKTFTQMSAKYCYIIKAKGLGFFLILFMSPGPIPHFYEKYKKFPRDGTAGGLGSDSLHCDAVWAHGTRTTKARLALNFKFVTTKKTREGWPLLTVETDVNGDSMSTNVLPWFVPLACRAGTWDSCLGWSSLPIAKKIFLRIHYFHSFVPISQQAGHAAVLGRLSLSMCLWWRP